MADQDGYEEIVLLFDAEQGTIEHELKAADFEGLIGRAESSGGEPGAGGRVSAVFAVVAAGLAVRSMVFFTFKVGADGATDPGFNLPLRYLADSAGSGPDLGAGAIRLACRGQCPVPWHSVNLWQPRMDGESSPIDLVQAAVRANRLGIQPTGPMEQPEVDEWMLSDDSEEYVGPARYSIIEPDPEPLVPFGREDDDPRPAQAANGTDNGSAGEPADDASPPRDVPSKASRPPPVDDRSSAPPDSDPFRFSASPRRPTPRRTGANGAAGAGVGSGARVPPPSVPPPPALPAFEREFLASQRELETRLTETFGEEGRISMENIIRQHNQRLSEITAKYRTDLAEQQRGYLDQIRACREEIQQLKAALRHEEQRSRRLQSLLRGDP